VSVQTLSQQLEADMELALSAVRSAEEAVVKILAEWTPKRPQFQRVLKMLQEAHGIVLDEMHEAGFLPF
jgi:hypothetical protein